MCSKCLKSEINIISKQLHEKTNSPTVDIIIKGESGTGKKDLVLAYLGKERQNFKHVIWVNSESELSIEYTFRKLHLQLNLIQYKNDTDIVDTKSKKIIKEVYEYLNNGRVLVVFSNVSANIKLENYLSNKDSKNVFYIVTTTKYNIEGKQNIYKKSILNSNCIKNSLMEQFHNENKSIVENCDLKFFDCYKICQLALKYYIGYINSQNICLTESRLKIELKKCENIEKLLQSVIEEVKKLGDVSYKILLFLSLVGSNDISEMLIKIFIIDMKSVKSCIKFLVNCNLVNKLLDNCYSIHELLQQKLKIDLKAEGEITLIEEITNKINDYLRNQNHCNEVIELNILLHSMHIVNYIIEHNIFPLPGLIELIYHVMCGLRKLRYSEMCEKIMIFVDNSEQVELSLFTTKLKLEYLRLGLTLNEDDASTKGKIAGEIRMFIDSLPDKYQNDVDIQILTARMSIEEQNFDLAGEILANIDDERTGLLFLHLFIKTKEKSYVIKKLLTSIQYSSKICKSKKYQNAIIEIDVTESDTHSIAKCFEICKSQLGVSHRKTLRALLLLAKQKYKRGQLQDLFALLEKELIEMHEHKRVYSILHPAYNKILETLCFYYQVSNNYEKVLALYYKSIEVLKLELLPGNIFVHTQIDKWQNKACGRKVSQIDSSDTEVFFDRYQELHTEYDSKAIKRNVPNLDIFMDEEAQCLELFAMVGKLRKEQNFTNDQLLEEFSSKLSQSTRKKLLCILELEKEHTNKVLIYALRNCSRNIVRYLVLAGAVINVIFDDDIEIVLRMAAGEGHVELVKGLLEAGVNVNTILRKSGDTALHSAAENGHIDILECLLEAGADAKIRNFNGYTALHLASEKGNVDVVKRLMASVADSKIKNCYGYTALHVAAERGHVAVVDCLMSLGADEKMKNCYGHTALHLAAVKGHTDVINCLIASGADVNFKTDNGYTALHSAAKYGHINTVNFLVEHGSDINSTNDYDDTPMYLAAENSYFDVVKCLLEAGADKNAKNNNSYTVLYWAAKRGHVDIVKALLDVGADINIQTNIGDTALNVAAESGNLLTVNCLLDYGADVNLKTIYGDTALSLVAERGNHDMIMCLLQAGADVNLQIKHDFLLLHSAIKRAQVGIVKFILNAGVDVNNIKSFDGLTALCWAAKVGNCDIVKCLLDAGANVNYKTDSGGTALYFAAIEGHIDIVKCLVEASADVNVQTYYGDTALYLAAEKGHVNTVKCLVGAGADINWKSKDGYTVLYWAAQRTRLDILKFFLESGADVNSKTNNGGTALYEAVQKGYVDNVKCLLEAGADPNIKTIDGHTALHLATNRSDVKCVKCLLEAGADVNIKSSFGHTSLHDAARKGHVDIVKCILNAGPAVNIQTDLGYTALHWAVLEGYVDIVKFLLEAGADVNLKTNNGDAVLHWVVLKGQQEIVKCILEAGADVSFVNKNGYTALDIANKNIAELIHKHLNSTQN